MAAPGSTDLNVEAIGSAAGLRVGVVIAVDFKKPGGEAKEEGTGRMSFPLPFISVSVSSLSSNSSLSAMADSLSVREHCLLWSDH